MNFMKILIGGKKNLPWAGVSLWLRTRSGTRITLYGTWSRAGITLQRTWTGLWLGLWSVTMAKRLIFNYEHWFFEIFYKCNLLWTRARTRFVGWRLWFRTSTTTRLGATTWLWTATWWTSRSVNCLVLNFTHEWKARKLTTLSVNVYEIESASGYLMNEIGHVRHRCLHQHVLHVGLRSNVLDGHLTRYRPISRWHSSCPTMKQTRRHCNKK